MSTFFRRTSGRASLQQRFSTLAIAIGVGMIPALGVAGAYPERPISLIVPAPPGGLTDTVARLVAEELRGSLQQQVIVENQAGAAGMIASRYVAQAKPDGYTLLMNYGTHLTAPVVYGGAQYHPVDDFAAVSQIADVVGIIAVSGDSPFKTWADLEKHIKSQNNPVPFGIPGIGSSPHFYGMSIADGAKMKIEVIPYRGESPMVTDLIGGVTTWTMLSPGTFKPLAESGKLRGLAVTSNERSAAVPDLPTMKELGLKAPGDVSSFIGVLAPAGTPPEIVDKLSSALHDIMQKPDIQQRFVENYGLTPMGTTAAAFANVLKSNYPLWIAARDAYDIKPQ